MEDGSSLEGPGTPRSDGFSSVLCTLTTQPLQAHATTSEPLQ